MNWTVLRKRWRRLALTVVLAVAVIGAISALIEHVLERRDLARLTAGETFYTTHGRRIRYHLSGENHPGPTLVLLDGLTASLEQWDGVQAALSVTSPVISYDRGGGGFSDQADDYGAIADADELDQLLHSRPSIGQVVLVSYSSSSMMATVYAATHPDIVKGIVLVEPAPLGWPPLPGPKEKSYRRVFWRFNIITLQSFFGYTRLKLAMSERHAPPSSPADERYQAMLKSWHHWLASTHEAMDMDASAKLADTAMAGHPFAHLPLGMLITLNPAESEWIRKIIERDKKVVASSELGVMRVVPGNHDQLLKDPAVLRSTVDMITTIADEARAKNTPQNAL